MDGALFLLDMTALMGIMSVFHFELKMRVEQGGAAER